MSTAAGRIKAVDIVDSMLNLFYYLKPAFCTFAKAHKC